MASFLLDPEVDVTFQQVTKRKEEQIWEKHQQLQSQLFLKANSFKHKQWMTVIDASLGRRWAMSLMILSGRITHRTTELSKNFTNLNCEDFRFLYNTSDIKITTPNVTSWHQKLNIRSMKKSASAELK